MNATTSLEMKVNELTRENTLLKCRLDVAMDFMSSIGDDFGFIDVMENSMEMTYYEIADFLEYRYDFTMEFRYAMEYLADNFGREEEYKQDIANMMTNEALRMYKSPDWKSLDVMEWFVSHWEMCGLSDDFMEIHIVSQMEIMGDNGIAETSETLDFISMVLSGLRFFTDGTKELIVNTAIGELQRASSYVKQYVHHSDFMEV